MLHDCSSYTCRMIVAYTQSSGLFPQGAPGILPTTAVFTPGMEVFFTSAVFHLWQTHRFSSLQMLLSV